VVVTRLGSWVIWLTSTRGLNPKNSAQRLQFRFINLSLHRTWLILYFLTISS